ncbi:MULTISPECIES: HNH endonuclease [Pseudomonas]|uniref:HNH endonuclease n=1 Tax=Pseudomonas aphyarum TaxID=2942629 RepID=A0ABT5PWK1_9PSED|nr:HNH endonuclease [Pseudomonas aphyarum]MDD0972123.1 HNH endonuclease [Pseudomonas aphyarum]MDD1128292.1 HNH endonuclease [Pseudomonas aphyarum]
MTTRSQKFINVINTLGPLASGANSRDGWPGTFYVQLSNQQLPIALHVSSISPHSRAPYELRFQNPAGENRVVSDELGTALPILLGIDDTQINQIYVATDGRSRVGRATRFSVLFHQRIISEARRNGWATYTSSTGEKVCAFVPMLLPAFIEQIIQNEDIPPSEIAEMAIASGVMDPQTDINYQAWAGLRATKAINVLTRKAGAGKRIRRAYGDQCAMCGLGSGLIQGAHIYPVEAPGSTDEIWNGLSLCYNHHKAFDLHLIGVIPHTNEIILHPSLREDARYNHGTANFVNSTWTHLRVPDQARHQPNAQMFLERYSYFSELYNWM